ncbi:MAG: hypothetical protein KGR98_01580 [Verrucomicrobia bacterium]|nr:hypothetical protein [Verrucomicrobiota bacterium]MDE3098554.1 hypothetical protein [Verrucomicrobiota bacterium]
MWHTRQDSCRDQFGNWPELAGFDGAGDTRFQFIGGGFEVKMGLQIQPPAGAHWDDVFRAFADWVMVAQIALPQNQGFLSAAWAILIESSLCFALR